MVDPKSTALPFGYTPTIFKFYNLKLYLSNSIRCGEQVQKGEREDGT